MANSSQLFKDDEGERLGNGYTPDDNQLRDIAGINKDQEAASDRSAESGATGDIADREKNASSTGKSDSSGNKSLGLGGLAAAESGMAGAAGTLFNPTSNLSRIAKLGSFLKQNRKKGLIGGGIAGSIIGILITLFVGLIPLKIESMVQNLQKHFFATSENALQKETQTMFENYIVKNVLPSYKRCGTVISSDCRVSNITGGNNPVTNLYKSWANAKIETKLATTYGIEFKFDRASGVWHLKAPGTSSTGDIIGDKTTVTVKQLEAEFQRAGRSTMRSAVKDAVQSETKWKQVFYRYKVGRLLEEKYGIKRCIVFCGTKDALSDFSASKKNAAKIYLVQRVLTPLNTARGAVIECMLDPKCYPEKTTVSAASPGTSGALNGTPESTLDTNIRTSLEELAGHYGITDSTAIKSMIDEYAKASESGFTKYALAAVLEKAGISATVSSQVTDAIPIVGWIDTGAKFIDAANRIGPAIRKITYASNAAAAVSLYMTYRTYADEIHTGNVDAKEVGSFVNTLGSGNSGSSSDPEIGGTASAEATPLYSNLMGTSASSGATASLNGSLFAKAYAASTNNNSQSSYKCADNNSVPNGKLVCSEEVLGQGSGLLDSAHTFLNLPGITAVTKAASLVTGFTSSIFSVLGSVLSVVPGFLTLSHFISDTLSPVITGIVNTLIPSPFGSNMSGGRTFDMMAAGADVAGNDSAHIALGGKVLTASQVAAITNEQTDSAQKSFSRQSFFSRMFDTNSSYSLVSKIAMNIPFNFQATAGNTVASLLSDPFGLLSRGFASLFSTPNVSATATVQNDPFNVPQYGYTADDLANIGDPQIYWDQNCSDNASQAYQKKDNNWNEAAANGLVDPNTGMAINTSTNPCLLIKATVGVAGGLFDTSLLASDDLANTRNN